jgi:hypothetical protein
MGTKYRNETIRSFQKQEKLSKAEYKILFEPKEEYSEEQELLFDEILQRVIDLQQEESRISLDMLVFPRFEFQNYTFPEGTILSFDHAIFAGKSIFEQGTFGEELSF